MNKLEVLEKLVEMFRRGEISPVSAEVLLADLPPEALSGPKTDAQGNVIRSWDADLTGYDAPYVLAAAIEEQVAILVETAEVTNCERRSAVNCRSPRRGGLLRILPIFETRVVRGFAPDDPLVDEEPSPLPREAQRAGA